MYVCVQRKERKRETEIFVWFSLSYRLLEDLSVEILDAWVEGKSMQRDMMALLVVS